MWLAGFLTEIGEAQPFRNSFGTDRQPSNYASYVSMCLDRRRSRQIVGTLRVVSTQVFGPVLHKTSTESLILAQDERWRRA